ncbi:MAG TPA: ABC transporter ATP-binding protein [Candidatus Faecivivens stercoravium]|uniref:ABC transporter ATP-binding protein n=1 Tax=Candidatus Faecivivens stercoravium TaxID=2840803 RepID=A0A9D1J573_9FIRM|nr:ABC transporter ATP-binding protein [Candidatus Faecivivens stercoravium]
MIEVQHLSKTFYVRRRESGLKNAAAALFKKREPVPALQDISFSVADGEMVGYIGPNGAGKSTTIKVMTGVLTPDNGICRIDGRTPWKERKAHVARIGVVFGQRSQLWWDLPVNDSFDLIRDIYRVPEDRYRKNVRELSEMLSLGEILRTPARQLSLGQRMRCEIAASLLHDPKVLFLDEPTIGLDAASKLAVREFIRSLNRTRGTTILLTTHDMQDIEALTRRIILIGKGRILLDGPLEDLKETLSPVRTVIASGREKAGALSLPEGVSLLSRQGEGNVRLTLSADTRLSPVPALIESLSRQMELSDLSVEQASMDEVVLSLYKQYKI